MNKKTKKNAHIESHLSVSEMVQTILLHNLDYLGQWEKAARSWDDIEGVHQTRVTFRRMRSALGIFRMAIPKSVSAPWSEQMRDLAGRLGDARDLDVFIDEALGVLKQKLPLPGVDALEARAREKRAAAYEAVRVMLDSPEYADFKRGFRRWVSTRAWEKAELKPKKRKALQGNVMPFARRVLDVQERRVLEVGTHVDKNSAEAMHQLRIECKKLRYAAEFFSPVFPGLEAFIGHMKGLQDLLGVMNDVAVMRGLLDHVLQGSDDPDMIEYGGAIVGWRTCHFHRLLEDFDGNWDEFVEAKHPWWKKSAASNP